MFLICQEFFEIFLFSRLHKLDICFLCNLRYYQLVDKNYFVTTAIIPCQDVTIFSSLSFYIVVDISFFEEKFKRVFVKAEAVPINHCLAVVNLASGVRFIEYVLDFFFHSIRSFKNFSVPFGTVYMITWFLIFVKRFFKIFQKNFLALFARAYICIILYTF